MTDCFGEYKITNIVRKDGNTEDDESRVGMEVILDRINLGLPAVMVLKHDREKALLTTKVVDKSETTEGILTVKTMNTLYTLTRSR